MSDSSPPRPRTAADPSFARRERVLVVDGVRWRVYESRLGQYDRRSRNHLFFECETAVRRVREFPPDWFDLPDERLMAVSEGR